MKPRIFIGSSSEGLEIANALQSNLEGDGEVIVWTQDVFRPSEFTLEGLLKQLDVTDFAIFVFSPDDTVTTRGHEHVAVRDNVVFELGLYVGRLGRDHTFIVAPRGDYAWLPSDLLGVTVVSYDGHRQDGRVDAALGPASVKLRAALKHIEPSRQQTPADFDLPIMERRGLLSAKQRELLDAIEAEPPAVSKEAIALRFAEMSAAELHYRLEQLRLLQFVVRLNAPGHDGRPNLLALHPLYAHAQSGTPDLRTSH